MKTIIVGAPVLAWVCQRIPVAVSWQTPAIGLADNGQIMAGVVYTDFNGPNVLAHIAAVPGRRWINRDFLWAIFHYPFETLKVKRITGLVGESNKDCQRFSRHLGFKIETKLKDADPSGAMFVFRMYRNECRWLNLNKRKCAYSGYEVLYIAPKRRGQGNPDERKTA